MFLACSLRLPWGDGLDTRFFPVVIVELLMFVRTTLLYSKDKHFYAQYHSHIKQQFTVHIPRTSTLILNIEIMILSPFIAFTSIQLYSTVARTRYNSGIPPAKSIHM